MKMVPSDGYFIFGGCYIGETEFGLGESLMVTLYDITGANILANIDPTNLGTYGSPVNRDLSSGDNFLEGFGIIGHVTDGRYMKVSELNPNYTGQIRLNTSGNPVSFVTK